MESADKLPCLREVYCEIYIEENIKNFKMRLILKCYLEHMVEKTLWEVKYNLERKEALKQKAKMHKKLLLFVMQFQPSLPKFESMITNKWHF